MSNKQEMDSAFKKAMALCAGREMCVSDVSSKLASWGLEPGESGKIIAMLVRDKFIDEERYARAFVNDKFRHNKWGKIKLAAELRRKKLNSQTIRDALAAIDETVYLETIRSLISNQRRRIKAKSNYELRGKLVRFMLSKGFESELVYDLTGDLEEDRD
ncbi:MAG: regulatory protein RecX [Bacteroidales bacterium]